MARTREKAWVECGRVVRPWGIRGELFVEWLSGSCPVEVGRGFVYRRNREGEYLKVYVLASRPHDKRYIVSFDGITSRNEAEELRGATFFLPEDELPKLPDGEYYSYQLMGIEVVTEEGDSLGVISKIFSAGGHDIYVARGKERETLIPAVDHVVVKIDLEERKMTIRAIEGLLD